MCWCGGGRGRPRPTSSLLFDTIPLAVRAGAPQRAAARCPGVDALRCIIGASQPTPLRPASASLVRFGSGKAEAAPDDSSSSAKSEEPALVYEGAKNKIVRTLKTLSIANLAFAVAATPILQYITAASGNSARAWPCQGCCFFGGGTTGALTWATTTYVLKIVTIPGKMPCSSPHPITGGEMKLRWLGRPSYGRSRITRSRPSSGRQEILSR